MTPWKELRYVFRKLARSPLFTFVSVLTLALAIGANTAVWSVVYGVLLKPLPFDEPDELVGIWHEAPGLGFDLVNQAPALHFTYRDANRSFAEVGMWDATRVALSGDGPPRQVDAIRVTEDVFRALRVEPLLGRLFTAEDTAHDAPETVVLSHGFWQRRFGGEPDAVGRTLRVDGRPRAVIGVMRDGLHFLDDDPELYLPFQIDLSEVRMGNISYFGLARLRPGVTLEDAAADVDRMIPLAAERYPGGLTGEMLEEAGFGANLRPLKQDAVGDVGNVLWVLMGTVGVVLLIACANVANLFLVRAENRRLETALRTALGASRGALGRGFLTESLTLAALGALAGVALAHAGIRALVRIAPEGLPRLDEIAIDGPVLAFALALTLLAGLLFGVAPLVRFRGRQLTAALQEAGRAGTGAGRHRARDALVVVQIALALVLLVGAGLMLRSFQALRAVDPGFSRPAELLSLRFTIPRSELEDAAAVARAHEELRRALAALPGAESATAVSALPLSGRQSADGLDVEAFPTPEGQLPSIRRFKWVAAGYFETLGVPVLAGRPIVWEDVEAARPVVVVSESLAREYWSSPAAALGQRVRQNGPWREIVGVVGEVRDDRLDLDPEPIVYWPMAVREFWEEDLWARRSMVHVVRSDRAGTASFAREARDAIEARWPDLPIAEVATLERVMRDSMARTAFTLVMLAVATLVALALGSVGIYGVTAYVVAQRTREIGLRMALGARRTDVSRMILRRALGLAVAGVALGTLAALGLTRLMRSLLYGVGAFDPATYGVVAAALVGVALLASYLPARRAAAVEPLDALRWE